MVILSALRPERNLKGPRLSDMRRTVGLSAAAWTKPLWEEIAYRWLLSGEPINSNG